MLHIIRYQFLQTVREVGIMFWALAFPIILGVMFYISFGNGDMGEDMDVIPVAVVEKETSGQTQAFLTFLKNMEGDVLKTETMREEEAERALEADEVDGIFYVKKEPELTVAKSNIEQSILKSLLDTYQKNAEMMMTIAEKHPEKIAEAAESLNVWGEYTKDVSVGGRTMDPYVTYFFALIAYACLSGAFLGVKGCCDGQANLSALGARRCITPTHKLQMLISDFLVLVTIHFFNIMILTTFIQFVLGIDLGGKIGQMTFVNLLGSVIGISLGILIGSISRLTFGVKTGLCVFVTLFPGFLAGLMFGDMKNVIEQHCPIINRINPAAVLSDAYYCMAVYNDTARMSRNLMILAGMSLIFMAVAFAMTRRERYDSI